jgi:hypothetical protein
MATTTNYGWTTPDDTALVKDGAAAIRTLGSSVDTTTKALNPSTTLGDIEYRSSTANTNTRLGIGSSGQGLLVVAGVPSWAASSTSILTTTGDLLYASAANTLARRGIGSTGQLLTVVGGVPTWATPAGSGKVLQVVQGTTTTQTTIASTSDTDTGITATITPSSATSKILVIVNGLFQSYRGSLATNQQSVKAKILRAATTIVSNNNDYVSTFTAGGTFELNFKGPYAQTYLDSPATTSATTYKVQSAVETTANSGAVYWQYNSSLSTITLLEIGA